MSKPDPRLAFTTRNGSKALGLLTEALKKRAGVVVLSGEPGVGKTTLLRKFALQSREAGHAVFVPEQPATSMDALLKAVCAQAGVAPSGGDRIAHLYALREHVDQRLKSGDFCAIFADSVDGVPDMMLRDLGLLVDLERSNMRPIQIVLAGTARLIDRLNTPEFNAVRKEVGAVVKLEPFERDETGAYLQHCLTSAGYRGPGLFSFAAIERIHAKTRGVPRAINQVAVAALAALKSAGGTLSAEAIDSAVASALAEPEVTTPAPMADAAPPPAPIPAVPLAPSSEIRLPSSGGLVGQPQTMTVRMMLDKLDREFNPAETVVTAPSADIVPPAPPAPPPTPAIAPAPPPAAVAPAPPPAPRASTEQVIAEAARTMAPSPAPAAAGIAAAAEIAPTKPAAPVPVPAPAAEKSTPSAADLVAEALAMVDAEEARQAAPAAPPAPAPRAMPAAPMPAPATASADAKPHNSARQRLLARLTGR